MMMLSRGVWIGFLATAYAAVLPSTQLPREVKTSSISSIVVFGDSFSDNGKRSVVIRRAGIQDEHG